MSTDDLVDEINRQLARLSREQEVDNSNKLALEFEPTVHLVTVLELCQRRKMGRLLVYQ